MLRIRRLIRNDQLILSVLAVIVGLVAGAGTVAIRKLIGFIQFYAYGSDSESLFTEGHALEWWQILVVPTAGGLLIGLFIYYAMPGRRPLGIANVIEASALRGGRMSFRAGIGAAIASSASIGVGASVGREGPAVHLGATMGAWIAERLHLTRSLSRALLGCGAAAAVAASFNAPIAGALFAHEVIVGHFALSAFAPIVIASVVGTIISRATFGNFPAFEGGEHALASIWEFPAFVGLGVLCGVTAILFMRSAMMAEDIAQKIPTPQWVKPAIGGFLVGLIALILPQIMGVGYAATNEALRVELSLQLLIALILAKILATSISVGAGFGGGVFTPSLMIGAMLGGAYGLIVTGILPEYSSGPSAYTIVGMGAMAAAVLGAPISTTLIVFELTGDYALTVAVMIAIVIASVITQQFQTKSFFHWQLERAGLDLRGGFETGLLRNIKVRSIIEDVSETVPVGMGLNEMRINLQNSEFGELFVIRDTGELVGTITLADLSEVAFDHDFDDLIKAEDVVRMNPPILDADDDLQTANKLIRDSGEHYIAVVENHETMIFVGTLHETAVMAAYNRALMEARAEEHDGSP
ncbi:MAG: chloride channel protein [Proteobacteria bacterium]|nr:chloride channel protein [Pseudomonadota bacterium]